MRPATPLSRLPWTALAVVTCGALSNVALNALNRSCGSPFYFDSIFTAGVSAVLGPWPGLFTALFTQLGMEGVVTLAGAPGTSMPFVFCAFATALIVGEARNRNAFGSVPGVLLVILAVTMANSVIGTFTATAVFGGLTHHGSDQWIKILQQGGRSLLEAEFWARVPLNLIDKGIAVAAAWTAWKYLSPAVSPATSSPEWERRGRRSPS